MSQDGVFDHHEHKADVLRVGGTGEVGVHRLLLVGVLIHVHLQDELLGRLQVLLRSCSSGKVVIFLMWLLFLCISLYLYGWDASTSLVFFVTVDFTVEAKFFVFLCWNLIDISAWIYLRINYKRNLSTYVWVDIPTCGTIRSISTNSLADNIAYNSPSLKKQILPTLHSVMQKHPSGSNIVSPHAMTSSFT